ncbi:uncharacterized protein LOC135839727 isoform X2 [Planococcus citri]|uniref:uncharacterized protein LOC135839727 isoform X2 n=1 Tax=Planococcus citri TaxID=170843 RepID=UPI0031F7B25A
MREKNKKSDTDFLLTAVAAKLRNNILKKDNEESTASLLDSSGTMNLSIEMPPSDDEWREMKANIDKRLTPDFKCEGCWPCELNYKIQRDRHTYNFCNVSLRVSIIEEGPVLPLLQISTAAQEPRTDSLPEVAPNISSINQDRAEGEYLYILVELKNDPYKVGYVIKDVSRTNMPIFSIESETNDRTSIRDLRLVVTNLIKKFEGCFRGKRFKSKECSTNGVEPLGAVTAKRKINEDSNSPECDVAERQSRLTKPHQELEAKFIAIQPDKPSKPAKLAATLLTILKDVHKCSLSHYHSAWLVPPNYKNEVIVFKYPSQTGVTPQKSGYDCYNMSLLWNENDFFLVFRVSPEPSKLIIQKLVSGLVPRLGAESLEEEEIKVPEHLKWYNLQVWLSGIDSKFLKKKGCGFYSLTPTDSSPSTSNASPSSR